MSTHENEKTAMTMVEDHELEKHQPVESAVISGDEAFYQAMKKEPPSLLPPPVLIIGSFVAFCCSTSNGYDGSLFGTLLANKTFDKFFNTQPDGIRPGIVTAIYQVGSVSALPFIGPLIDTWGRKYGMFLGALMIVLGVIIQVTCIVNGHLSQFMGGRFFMGFGVSVASAAGPCYVVEVAHPAYRGIVTGLYNVMWPVGAIVASGAARGGLNHAGNTSWMIPLGLQMMFPCIVLFGSLFLPESPRWLFTRGHHDKARDSLVRLHGRGNPDSEWVKLQLTEYEQFLDMDGADKRWWDYRALFRDRASFYRLSCNCLVATFGQWAGNSIVSYFIVAFLEIAGIQDSVTQMNFQLGLSAVQIAAAVFGATLVDRFGRRPMLIGVNLVCCVCWIAIIIPCGIANVGAEGATNALSKSGGAVVVAFVFIFQACYSVGWTPMQALYPVEVLSFEMRAKGMAFSSLFTSVALMSNEFGVPVAMHNIAWKTYIVFCIWCVVQAGIIWLMMPETKGRTLEELDQIFNSPNPVKKSLEKKALALDSQHNVVHVDTA